MAHLRDGLDSHAERAGSRARGGCKAFRQGHAVGKGARMRFHLDPGVATTVRLIASCARPARRRRRLVSVTPTHHRAGVLRGSGPSFCERRTKLLQPRRSGRD
jgi:hypothetical protein